jgi:transposase
MLLWVDTHKDVHAAAVLGATGRLLGTALFPTAIAGHDQLLAWLRNHGQVIRVGVEGTGSYGAGLMHHLRSAGVHVVEVNRPNRQMRRQRGKSDPVDAEAAARAALGGTATGTPKSQDGKVEAIRVLRLARRSAMKARTQAANQIQAIIEAAPSTLRESLRVLSFSKLIPIARRLRWRGPITPLTAAKLTLKGLADRWAGLDAEIRQLDDQLESLVEDAAPRLIALPGVGAETGGALLVAIGDNPDRLRSEAAFAALCGASPVDASSGRQQRHRLNRGGNRDANRALWVIVMCRMAKDATTRAYVEKRTRHGLSKREIVRCLKRYVARQIYRTLLPTLPSAAGSPQLKAAPSTP